MFAERVRARLERARGALELARLRTASGGLPVTTQLAEMIALRLYRGIGPTYYHEAKFWDGSVSWQEKVKHIGPRAYRKLVYTLNSPDYRKLSQNKIPEKAILSMFGIPTPRFLGYLHPTRGYSPFSGPLRDPAELAQALRASGMPKVCFKTVEGWGGSGFSPATVADSGAEVRLTPLLQEEALDLEEYCRRILNFPQTDAWIIEEYLEQHAWYRSVNPTSVNTMRLWVVQAKSRPPQVMGGYFRMGRAGHLVDNRTAGGGIYCRIDTDTGVLEAALDSTVSTNTHPSHPDTGTPLEGERLPFWEEAKALAKQALLAFPRTRFAGVDVAVGPEGPVIVELNVEPGRLGAAIIRKSLLDHL